MLEWILLTLSLRHISQCYLEGMDASYTYLYSFCVNFRNIRNLRHCFLEVVHLVLYNTWVKREGKAANQYSALSVNLPR